MGPFRPAIHSQVNPSTELRTDLIYTVEFLCQEWVALPVKEYQENLVLQLQRMISRLPWLFSSLHPLTQDFLVSTMHIRPEQHLQHQLHHSGHAVGLRSSSVTSLSTRTAHYTPLYPVIPRFGLLCRRPPGHRPELHRFFSVFFFLKTHESTKKLKTLGHRPKSMTRKVHLLRLKRWHKLCSFVYSGFIHLFQGQIQPVFKHF